MKVGGVFYSVVANPGMFFFGRNIKRRYHRDLAPPFTGEASISAAFLSSILPDGDVAPFINSSLNEGSVIEGRHSTTFELLLEITGLKDHTGGTRFTKRVTCAELPQQPLRQAKVRERGYGCGSNKILRRNGYLSRIHIA